MAGAWKQMVWSRKRTFNFELNYTKRRTLKSKHIVNSLPLTFVLFCHDDSASLTPNHFLVGTSSMANTSSN